MTILRPNKTGQLTRAIGIFFALFAVLGGFYIYNYAQIAEARHELEKTREEIVSAKEENALLKQEFYGLTDPLRLKEVAESEGLVIERRPNYLTYYR